MNKQKHYKGIQKRGKLRGRPRWRRKKRKEEVGNGFGRVIKAIERYTSDFTKEVRLAARAASDYLTVRGELNNELNKL